MLDLILRQQQLTSITRLLQQQQRGAGAQIRTLEPLAAFFGGKRQPFLNGGLFDRQLLLQHIKHRLIAIAERVETITQTQCFFRIIQHAGIGQPAALHHFQQAVGHDAVESNEPAVITAAAQQFQTFHRAVVGEEEVVAVIAPMHLGSVFDHAFDLFP